MKKPAHADKVFIVSLRCLGFLLAMAFFLADAALGADGIQSNGHSNNPSGEESPLIGGGVRTPPDIGASGTSSSTTPVRTESPTDEPQILPDVSPVPTDPSTPEKAPVKESEPLGQPDHLQKTPEKMERF